MLRLFFGLAFLCSVILASGCETVKTATSGLGEAMATDIGNTWGALKKADQWMQENYW
jgi:hypothetical protein